MARSSHRNVSPVVVDVGDGRMAAVDAEIDVDPKKCPAVKAGLLQPVKVAASPVTEQTEE